MSTINTNAINVNYPVPGVNNNSQGFRDNFASIVNNLNAAGNEITDLQNKVVVKQALIGTTINNDMANTLISNASTRSFRATTFNLGNALAGTVLVNASLGDVQYGTIAGDTTINFGSWSPAQTQSNVQINLAISNTLSTITFPSSVTLSPDTGATTLENYSNNISGNLIVTVPNGVTQLNYMVSTTDCGNTLYITPINRPRITTQIQQRLISPTGFQGDVNGDVAVGPSFNQLNITSTNAADYFSTSDTTQLYTDLPIVFTGTSFEANITTGTTYYVRNVSANTYFTVSSTIGGGNINLAGGTGLMYANPVSYLYVATDTYNSTAYPKNVLSTTVTTNVVTLNNTTGLTVNSPIIFDANIGGLYSNTVYYIKSISSPNITVSQSRTNGVADTVVTLSSNSTATTANIYVGNDIWKSIPLLPAVDNGSGSAAFNQIIVYDDLSVLGNTVIQGNLTVNGTYIYENISSLAIEDPIISLGRGPNNTPLVADDNKDRGEQLWYYTGGSEKSAFIGWDDSQGKLIAATDVSISSEVVTVNSYGNFLVGNLDATNVNATNFSITGTFNSNTVTANTLTGNVNAVNLNVSGVANIPTVGGVRIGGGLNGYYLVTDGTGNLSWVSGGGSGVGVVAGADSQIQYNNAGNFGATAGFTFNSSTNLLSTPGAITVTGNITGANIITSGLITVTGNANVGNLGTSGLITVTGNANVGNLGTSGLIIVTGNANVGNLGTSGLITATGNVDGGNINTAGIVSATGNGTFGNINTAGIVSATGNGTFGNINTAGIVSATGNITGGNVTSNNYVIVSANNAVSAAGTTQADATLLTKSINVVTTVPSNSGVKLPVAEAGMRIIVRNSTSTALNVYPNTGAAIEPALANAAYTLNATTSMEFFCSTGGASGQWFTLF